jgi:outer membrane receptor protein involved in Fe transport
LRAPSRARRYLLLGALALTPGLDDAVAQDTSLPGSTAQTQASGVISYPPEFFDDIRPSSAYDMVQRIPGFSFDGGNSSIRGFAGSGGNVLVDGSAPSTKSISLSDLLRRIPPSSVLRIDLIRGGAPGIDMQGRSVIANIIRKDETSVTGSVRPQLIFFGGAIGRSLRADMTARTNTLTVSGNMEIAQEKGSASETDILRLTDTGAVRDRGPQVSNHWDRTYAGAITIESNYGGNGTVTANIGIDLGKNNDRDTTIRTTPAGVATTDFTTSSNKNDEFEASLDYERDFGAFRLHALALKNFNISSNLATNEQASGISTSSSKTKSGEGIFRATAAGDYAEWLSLESGAEGAINNRYSSQTRLVGGVNLIVPNSNVRVEEQRGEIFATANLRYWPGFRSEWSVRYEASTIQQTGDTNKEKFFSFVKPRAVFTYDVTDTTQLRFRVERTVGQLNFGSFAASSDFVNGTVTAGNPNLEPERAWVYEGTWDQRFWDKGAFTASYSHSEVEAINDRILIVTPTGTFDAPGNIGRGTRDTVRLNLSFPLDYFGLTNGMLKPTFTWRDSVVSDPVTGVSRRSTGETLVSTGFTYTQDIAWLDSTLTVDAFYDTQRWSYRLRELTHEGQDISFSVSWDWKISPDLLFHIRAENFLPRERFRERTFFNGTRAGTISSFENSITPYEPRVDFYLRKNF